MRKEMSHAQQSVACLHTHVSQRAMQILRSGLATVITVLNVA